MKLKAILLTCALLINSVFINDIPSSALATSSLATASEASDLGTYKLAESSGDLTLWTDYPSERTFKDEAIPTLEKAGIDVYLAKNEFEPFQLNINPAKSQKIQVSLKNKTEGIAVDLYKVDYVKLSKTTDHLGRTGDYPDPLYPIEFNAPIEVKANENATLWFSVKTDENIAKGDYVITVRINTIEVPVTIHVFDFAIPKTLQVKSQINISTSTMLQHYGVTGTGKDYWMYVDLFKQFMIDHRLTPKSVLWSGGLTSNGGSPYIDYNSATGALSDPHGIWGFEYPASRYLDGKVNTLNAYLPEAAFNEGYGFPSFMAMTFKNNDASADQRPDTFEGISRKSSDWYLTNNLKSPYNLKWFNYIQDIEQYLKSNDYLDRAYYYFANEPQDQEDYDAVSWYASALKATAPDLKLMVSEEPKPEIYNNPKYPNVKIDQWLPVLNNYNPEISWDREANNQEETWIYFLHGTKPPYFNPITLDHPGIESKLTGWFLWKYRIKGIAHYSFNDFYQNVWTNPMTSGHNGDNFMLYPPSKDNQPIAFGATNHRFVTSIRFELMRDSLEDYEYLYMLNKQKQPEVYKENPSDEMADRIINGLTSYNRDSHYMYTLRKYMGMKIQGSLSTIPDIESATVNERSDEPLKAYYINFQDPSSSPTTNPLVVNNKTYMKIGWNTYDQELGYGWYGDMNHVMYKYISGESNPLKASILYDDWGREKTFEFDLPNGEYLVTVSCGWKGKTYLRNQIEVEGISFFDDQSITDYLERTEAVTIKDNKLTMAMGIFDEYTMLNYMNIEPLEAQIEPESETPSRDSPSAWAVNGINALAQKGILPASFFKAYKSNMSRGDYAELMMRTYMALTGKKEEDLLQSPASTFVDTSNIWILRAHAYAVISGYGNGKFGPIDGITREQVAIITMNMLRATGVNLSEEGLSAIHFKDHTEVSTWAEHDLLLANKYGVINGDDQGSIMPKQALTREQALIIAHNIIKK